MLYRKRDYKDTKYNTTNAKKKNENNNKIGIIIRYSIYLLIILLISILLGVLLFKQPTKEENTDNQIEHSIMKAFLVILINSETENNEAEEDNNDSINPLPQITDGSDSIENNETITNNQIEILSYYLFLTEDENVSFIVLPPYTNLLSEILPDTMQNNKIEKPLIEAISKQFNNIEILGYAFIDGNILLQSLYNDNRQYHFPIYEKVNNKTHNEIMNNPSYIYLMRLPNIFNEKKVYNYISFHSILIVEILQKLDSIRLNDYSKTMIIDSYFPNTKNEKYIVEMLQSIEEKNISYIKSPIELDSNDTIYIENDYNEYLKDALIFDNTYEKEKIRLSIINGSEKPFDTTTITKEIKKYDVDIVNYKLGNILENTILINYQKDIDLSYRLSNKMNNVPVFYSDFYPNEDFEVILYLGKDYYKYFDLK